MYFSYVTCGGCGISVSRAHAEEHTCDRERWIAHQVAKKANEIENIDEELASYLATPKGRFELWYASLRPDLER